MEQPTQKKGMSKGCLIALIVFIVLIVMVAVALITCWIKKDDLIRFGTVQGVTMIKSEIAKNPPAGIDTVQINAVVDGFVERLNAEENIDYERFGEFGERLQGIGQGENLDSLDIIRLRDAMIDYYPELESLIQVPGEDTSMIEDTTAETAE